MKIYEDTVEIDIDFRDHDSNIFQILEKVRELGYALRLPLNFV